MDEPWTADEIFAALGAARGIMTLRLRQVDEETGENVIWVEGYDRDGHRYRIFADSEYGAALALAEALGVELPDEALPRRR